MSKNKLENLTDLELAVRIAVSLEEAAKVISNLNTRCQILENENKLLKNDIENLKKELNGKK